MGAQTNTISLEGQKSKGFNWRLFAFLLAMVTVGLLALVPYGLTLAGQELKLESISQLPVQFVSQLVLHGFLIWVGLKLSPRVGLGVPLLSSRLAGEKQTLSTRPAWLALLFGLAAGIGIILVDGYVFAPKVSVELQILGDTVRPPVWQGFLASFYGALVEEIMMRFFMMTVLVWIGGKIRSTADGKPAKAVFWVAILISGLAFGIAHLPAAAALGINLSPLYIIRTLFLNAVGILYGWLYWKRGLEFAMLAHFSTDLAVHVLGAFLLG